MEKLDCHWSGSRCVCIVLPSLLGSRLSLIYSDGKKMSKSLKNYPDPNLIINQYGADATR